MHERPDEHCKNRRLPCTEGRWIHAAILLLGVGSVLLSSGCYQRVVKDSQGTYVGEVHEPNLPDDTRGFWVETFDPQPVPVQTNSPQGTSETP